MPEAFKNLFNADLIHTTAGHLQRAWPAFDAKAYIATATKGLDALEMKARAMQIADALEHTLPSSFAQASRVVTAALAPATPGDDLKVMQTPQALAAGLSGWFMWPLGEWVVRQGMQEPQLALQTLHALTQRHTSEWAIRPFIVNHPVLTYATLHRWLGDGSVHVRRLVSEGSRPRLPWGLQLKSLIADPSPTLPLLLKLQDDKSEYVRRSVANHLNDIAKDHPKLVTDWVAQHLPGAPPEREALLRHATRTLVKDGDPRALKLWGVGGAWRGEATLALSAKKVRVGESLSLAVRLKSSAKAAQDLLLDYAVHHVKADGSTSAKVFKGWKLKLAAGAVAELSKSHSLKPITTRRYYAGVHRVELLINGQAAADAAFELRL
jgi:3-methyladenine DNA glycosylase AlkC